MFWYLDRCNWDAASTSRMLACCAANAPPTPPLPPPRDPSPPLGPPTPPPCASSSAHRRREASSAACSCVMVISRSWMRRATGVDGDDVPTSSAPTATAGPPGRVVGIGRAADASPPDAPCAAPRALAKAAAPHVLAVSTASCVSFGVSSRLVTSQPLVRSMDNSFSRSTFLRYSFRMMERDIASLFSNSSTCACAAGATGPEAAEAPALAALPRPAATAGEATFAAAVPCCLRASSSVTPWDALSVALSSWSKASCTRSRISFEMPSDVSPARISTACPVMSSSSPPPSSSAASTTLVPDCRGDAGGAASLKRALPEALPGCTEPDAPARLAGLPYASGVISMAPHGLRARCSPKGFFCRRGRLCFLSALPAILRACNRLQLPG
mmetsp:Transcript_35993/g.106408  ORF Transcript_35993/g.106408 Transcript_35993/m.106408 type:complete len:385 (+) Transcript_35993:4531-5685(+)